MWCNGYDQIRWRWCLSPTAAYSPQEDLLLFCSPHGRLLESSSWSFWTTLSPQVCHRRKGLSNYKRWRDEHLYNSHTLSELQRRLVARARPHEQPLERDSVMMAAGTCATEARKAQLQWNLSNMDILGPIKFTASWLGRCPHFRGQTIHIYIWSWALVKCPD